MSLIAEHALSLADDPIRLFADLLTTIEAKSAKLAEAIRLAAIPTRFDHKLLKALRATDDDLEDKIIERLNQFSFLGESEGEYFITREVRDYLLAEQQKHPAWFVAAHRRALEFFQRQLVNPIKLTPVQHEKLQQALLYHLLVVEPTQGVALLEQLFRQTSAEYRYAAAERFLAIAEEQRPLLPPQQALYLDYLQGVLARLHGRLTVSHERLADLLIENKEQLTPDLRARIHHELGRTLTEQSREVEAITFIQQALTSFTQQGNQLERALTLLSLGRTSLQLALEVWGGGEPFLVKPSRFRLLLDILSFVTRLPLVIYLIAQLGLRSLLPVIHRIGRNMDWLVARLFVTAANHFRQAQTILIEVGDVAGLVQVQEDLGRLYLSFNHLRASERIWRELLQQYGNWLDPYRKAVAQLGLGWVLLRQGQLPEARQWLEQVEPVFTHYGHERRMAQTQTLLAQLAVREQQPAQALPHYLAALTLWQKTGNRQEATAVVHQLEALHTLPELPMADRHTAHAASAFTVERLYLNRYHHPALDLFLRLALVTLVIAFLFTLSAAVRSETGTRVDATAALIKPLEASTEDELTPLVQLTVTEQLRPDFDIPVVISTTVLMLLTYLVVYTLVGLYFILRTPLETLEETQQTDLRVGANGLQMTGEQHQQPLLQWAEIEAVVLADRFLMGKVTSVFSRTALLTPDRQLVFDGYINYYIDLQTFILRQLGPQTLTYNLGFKLPASLSGLVFFAALLLLGIYVIFAKFELTKLWLTTPLLAGYSLSAFYPLSYLGIALPLIWWFIIQPLRQQLIFAPEGRLVWVVSGSGLFFALTAFTHFAGWTQVLQLARPDIVPGVLAIFLLVAAALHILRARRQALRQILSRSRPAADQAFVFSPRLRATTALVTGILLILLLWQIGRELVSFHYLVQGNADLQTGEGLHQQSLDHRITDKIKAAAFDAQAQTAYQQALANYDQSLALEKISPVYNSRGLVLDRLGREPEAIAAYQQAARLDPLEAAYQINQALTYINQAARTVTPTAKIELYQQALTIYDKLLDTSTSSQLPTPYAVPRIQDPRQRAQVRFFRASAYYALARATNRETRLDYAQRARQEYAWLTLNDAQADPKRVAGYYAGLGWSQFLLRYLHPKLEEEHTDNRFSQIVHQAIQNFAHAADLDKANVSAYTGLGWAYWSLLFGIDGCAAAQAAGIDEPTYVQYRVNSVEALTKTVELQPLSAIHYRTRAQMRWLLRDCPGYNAAEVYRAAIDDYDEALTYAPTNAGWHYRRGTLYVALAQTDPITAAKQAAYQGAVDSYTLAVQHAPTVNDYMNALKNAYLRLGLTPEAALDAALTASGRAPGRFDTYFAMAQNAFQAGRYSWAIANLQPAVTLAPDHYEAHWLLAQSQYNAKDYTGTLTTTQRLLQLAPDAYDPLRLTAWSYYQRQRYTETLATTDQALLIKPDNYDLYWLRANTYLQLQEQVKAKAALGKALEFATTAGENRSLMKFARTALGDDMVADQAAEKALALAQKVSEFTQLSESFLNDNEETWALAAARKGNQLEQAPGDPRAELDCHLYRATHITPLAQLGCLAYKAGKFTIAISATLEAIALQPTEARLYFNLGMMQLAQGDVAAARNTYAKAIALSDQIQDANIRRARYNEALINLRRMVADPQNLYLEFIEQVRQARGPEIPQY